MVLATAIVLLAFSAAAAAEPPCLADVQKFCADTPAGGGKIQACLEAHEAELSGPCKQRVGETGRRVGPLVNACRWDIVHFCSDVQPGGGRIASCLQGKRDELSATCKAAVSKAGP